MGKVHKSAPVFFKASSANIDRDANVIKDVVIIQSGKDKYGDNFDETSLKQFVEQGNAQSQGVKSRFGHPNMCDSSLGSFLGRYKNFRVGSNGDIPVVLADLYLDDTAKNSPTKGNMFDYVVSMTEKNADMFGNSVVYNPDEEAKVIEKDAEGNDTTVFYQRVKSFIASDIVDSPAATTSLFRDFNQGEFANTVTKFLDENPEVLDIIEKDESVLNSFLNKYKIHKEQKENIQMEKSIIEKIKSLLGAKAKEAIETMDGSINCDPSVAVGSLVTDSSGAPMASTTIPLKDGRTIKTDENGKITEVVAAEAAPVTETPEAKELVEVKAKLKEVSDLYDTVNKSFDLQSSQYKELKDLSDALVKEVEQKDKDIAEVKTFLKSVKTSFVPSESNKTFAQSLETTTSKNDADPTADEIKAFKNKKPVTA